MLEGVVVAIVIFAGGDFTGGGEADVAVVPSLKEAGGAGFVDIEGLAHGTAGPSLGETVDKAVFVGVSAEPLPFDVVIIVISVENGAVGGVDEVTSVAAVMIAGAGGGTETAAGGAFGAKTGACGESMARIGGFVGVVEVA